MSVKNKDFRCIHLKLGVRDEKCVVLFSEVRPLDQSALYPYECHNGSLEANWIELHIETVQSFTF